MKIHTHCVPNAEDRCIQCRGRRISMKKKRICPLYTALKKKDPVELYEYFATETTALRQRIEDLEGVVRGLVKGTRLN